jgi:phosphatidylserine/phosphatidylglycerophosphate/cardiolipin synthase-like enzyme
VNRRARIEDWFLSGAERGNPATVIDDAHLGKAWSTGNAVRPLVHGATYFAELFTAIERTRDGDLVLFTDWRGDPDELLTADAGSEVGAVLCRAARRGVRVHGLVWRSHLDRFQFSAQENRHLGEEIDDAGGCCLLDMRVRTGGSHHQKFVVLRHPGRPELDIAYLGGIDLCHGRRDDAEHAGDPQRQPMAAVYGDRPPWHDVQLAITGPAVADIETVFRERWDDPQPLSRNPVHRLADLVRHDDHRAALPAPLPVPEPTGTLSVQLLRTYPRRVGGYPFAPDGERSVARGYRKALSRAQRLIYLEDQYLWSRQVAGHLAQALRDKPDLHLVAVLPHHPDQDGRALPPNLIGRNAALDLLRDAAPDRVAVFGIENHAGTPVYVHAKVCVIDDLWVTTGSDNFNRRSWTHDSELSAAVWDDAAAVDADNPNSDGTAPYPLALRRMLAAEHLDRPGVSDGELDDPADFVQAFHDSAAALQGWHDAGRTGARPAGRVRPIEPSPVTLGQRVWATPLYRTMYDPDGRRRGSRGADDL